MYNAPMHDTSSKFHLVLVVTVAATALAFMALTINLCTYGYIVLKVHRRMLLFREKTKYAERLLSQRRFADDLIGKLSNVPNFDSEVNKKEIDTLISTKLETTP